MKSSILKKLLSAVLLLVLIAVSGCSSEKIIAPTSDSATEITGTRQPYEIYIGKSSSWINKEVGQLNYEYIWSGADYYSAKESDIIFAFPTYQNYDEATCCAITAPFNSLLPDLAAKANSAGFVTADEISKCFDYEYTYSFDDANEMCYIGTTFKKSDITGNNYQFIFYPEENGSCSVESMVIVKAKS